jgi:vacuole morphology and inheritance protein 14
LDLAIAAHVPTCCQLAYAAVSAVGQVAREGFVVFFSEVFDAMFRLCADSETNVQNAVQFLDNLVKVSNNWGKGSTRARQAV